MDDPAAVIADLWLMRGLLGRSGQAERIRELEASRARLVDDSAALLRRVERNLHDGAQARLVALTMHLGRARDQLGDGGEPGDLDRARDLMAAAHQGAKAALTELRDLARGIHPPALDAGLEDALASLAATSATPASVTAAIAVSGPPRPSRPSPTSARPSCWPTWPSTAGPAHAAVDVAGAGRDPGADGRPTTATAAPRPRPGGGLAGLAQRAAAVDGTLRDRQPGGRPDRS